MARLFADYPEALRGAQDIVESCRFSLDELKYQYPEERLLPGLTANEALKRLTCQGAKWRHPEGVPETVITLSQA